MEANARQCLFCRVTNHRKGIFIHQFLKNI